MKTKVILVLAVLAFTFVGKANAQMDECLTTASLFYEPAKVKNYEAALPHYNKVVQECPQYSLATYQYAVKMFEHFIENGDKSKITELQNAYNLRMKYYPSKSKVGDIMSDIAQIKYDNGIGTKLSQFNEFDKAFKTDAETFKSPKRIYTYFSLAKDLFESGEKDIQEVFDLYDVIVDKIGKEEAYYAAKLTQLLDKQEAGTALTKKEEKRLKGYEKNLGAYGVIKGSVDGKLGTIADCENLIPLYQKNWEEKKNDVNWLKSSAGRLNAKDCDTPMFYEMVQQLHRLQPSASSAFYLGRLAEKDGKASEALNYYNQAVDLESDPSQKVKYYRSIAENFRKKGSYGQARTYYRKLLEIKPNDGNSYLKLAQMYAKSSNSCGSSVFEKRAINWLAAQMADKAARVDPSIASTARSAASSYRQRAPSKTDIFSAGMAGKTVSFRCWVGGSVRVPNL
ncbi:MAG: tetratricopeptide repeat protein [Flavobacteriaceae bacterium]|nr:tetratricopeptide repeat protein [Flavobacteriaceae bacterium]